MKIRLFYSAENQPLLVCNSATDDHASVMIPFLDNGGISTGAVVGIIFGIIGVISLIAIVIVTVFCCCKKKGKFISSLNQVTRFAFM